MATLTPEEIKDIEKRAESYIQLSSIRDAKIAYIAGATEERLRAKGLVECLEYLDRSFGLILNSDKYANIAAKAIIDSLTQYNKQP